MRSTALFLTLLLVAACRDAEERRLEQAREEMDSLIESTRTRPPPPDTAWDYRLPSRATKPQP